jgi:hypothetical protein
LPDHVEVNGVDRTKRRDVALDVIAAMENDDSKARL